MPEREPIVQNVIERNFSPEKEMINVRMLETNIEKMTPIRIILFAEKEWSSEKVRNKINIRERKANKIDIGIVLDECTKGSLMPRAREITAPNAAPEDTPKVEPSARGFLKTPCMAAPQRERAAPHSATLITLGSRMFRIMLACVPGWSELPVNLEKITSNISLIRIDTLPVQMHNNITTQVSAASRAQICNEDNPDLFCIGIFRNSRNYHLRKFLLY